MTDEVQAPQAAPSEAPKPISEAQAAGNLLKQLFPALFAGAPKPIKLKIQSDIEARAPGRITKAALTAFLRRHTATTAYLNALTRAKQRFDLDGQPAGELSSEHKAAAVAALADRKARMQQRDAEMAQARQWRADLLRDYERSAFSRANFCALKNVAEAALDALLEQARTERAAQPVRPTRTDDRRAREPGKRPQRAGEPGRQERRPSGRRDPKA
ncbi:sRNA-binding protein [Inhella inkyongensis]|uniref:SRNA-binding protein n=1 Tax=Inhella inkyongensis TaxID=392593 RepID=A0A840SD71_9BURK|nr:ProQ/FinO family protein [Inhella inkyongensis]MBB5206249.1 sRNA-binding protein [Inhella inkyongensis]